MAVASAFLLSTLLASTDAALGQKVVSDASVPERVRQAFKTDPLESYGLSEGTCGSACNPIDGLRKPGSVGLPLEGQEVRVVDEHEQAFACLVGRFSALPSAPAVELMTP